MPHFTLAHRRAATFALKDRKNKHTFPPRPVAAFQGIAQVEAVYTYIDSVSKELDELEKQIREKAAIAGVSIEFVNEGPPSSGQKQS